MKRKNYRKKFRRTNGKRFYKKVRRIAFKTMLNNAELKYKTNEIYLQGGLAGDHA